MKRSIAFLLSLTLVYSAVSCSGNSSSTLKNISGTAVTDEVPAKIKLENHMTEKERSCVSSGELTVFEHMQDSQKKSSVPDDGVYLELWSEDDWSADIKEYYKDHPEELEGTTIEEFIEKNRSGFNEIHDIFINGRCFNGYRVEPILGYDGGELRLREPSPYFCCSDGNGGYYYVDEDNNRFSEEEIQEKYDSFYAEERYLTFADFEEFKPYLKKQIERVVRTFASDMDEETIRERIEYEYNDNIAVWEAVIAGNYKTLPVGTAEKFYEEIENSNAATWEIDRPKVEEIAPYVKEYNIYDEQLDTNFVVHVTLPPDFDPQKTYPAYVLTDGVWRFNNSADLRKAMEEGKASEVIIVSIGYDYSIDGTNDEYRIKYFCDRCEDFLTFITDDLMPYLGEEYNIDYSSSTLFGHSLGGTFAHYAVFNSDKYENQPFRNYIIGSPAFWSPGFLPYTKGDEFRHEYGYFDRNDSLDKNLFICGGADEDPVYQEYYGENDSTLEGIQHLMDRLKEYGVTTAESKIYPNSEHYQFIPEMLVEVLEMYYPPQ